MGDGIFLHFFLVGETVGIAILQNPSRNPIGNADGLHTNDAHNLKTAAFLIQDTFIYHTFQTGKYILFTISSNYLNGNYTLNTVLIF